MSDNKPEQESNQEKDKSALTKGEPTSKVEEKTESKPKESIQEARRKRVQRLLQIFGIPSSGFGVAATVHFLGTGEVEKAAIREASPFGLSQED